jgi:ABC-type amino acid transport system permease subunit
VFKGTVQSIDFTAGSLFGCRLARVRAQGTVLNIVAVVIGIVSGVLTFLAKLITNPANQGITGEKLGLTIAAAALAVVAPVLVLLSNSWFKPTDVPS